MKRHLGQEGLPQLGRLQQSAHVLANEIRSLSHALHPGALRHVGLVAALRATCRELDGKDGLSITLAASDDLPALSPGVSLCLYRVAQQALHNVVQHAGATHARLILARQDGRLRMTVCDDGRGFEPADARKSGGVGLISMEERVRMMRGTIEIDSRPHRGTEVRVEIPLDDASRGFANP
jgi:two-component system sensor histidine kinase UhpB